MKSPIDVCQSVLLVSKSRLSVVIVACGGL